MGLVGADLPSGLGRFLHVVSHHGTWHLFDPESYGHIFDHLALSMAHGHLDLPPDIIGNEAYVIDGRHYGYWGPFPAFLRLPLALFGPGSWVGSHRKNLLPVGRDPQCARDGWHHARTTAAPRKNRPRPVVSRRRVGRTRARLSAPVSVEPHLRLPRSDSLGGRRRASRCVGRFVRVANPFDSRSRWGPRLRVCGFADSSHDRLWRSGWSGLGAGLGTIADLSAARACFRRLAGLETSHPHWD